MIDSIVGDVAGKRVIVLDDEVATGGSVVELLARLRERGTTVVSLACTHGLFTGPASARLDAQPELTEIVTTDTVPLPADRRPANLTVCSVAPLFADAICRIHLGEPVSSMFAAVGDPV